MEKVAPFIWISSPANLSELEERVGGIGIFGNSFRVDNEFNSIEAALSHLGIGYKLDNYKTEYLSVPSENRVSITKLWNQISRRIRACFEGYIETFVINIF